jgi:large subunit ribosomal protein L9
MKVLLRSDVRGLGRRGDIVDVKTGYARNFLLPRVRPAGQCDHRGPSHPDAQGSRRARRQESRSGRGPEGAHRSKRRLTIASRASANGRLFGSIGETDIVNAIRTATGISLDRHAIHLAEHLKDVGSATATATLFDGVEATVTIEVVAK